MPTAIAYPRIAVWLIAEHLLQYEHGSHDLGIERPLVPSSWGLLPYLGEKLIESYKVPAQLHEEAEAIELVRREVNRFLVFEERAGLEIDSVRAKAQGDIVVL